MLDFIAIDLQLYKIFNIMQVSFFGTHCTSEFLYLITNHATDAVKTVIHMVNMEFRKLKKNNVRNTDKT